MKVTPSWPFVASFGLCAVPVRGVTAEWRTSRVNSPARFRSAGFFKDDFKDGFDIFSPLFKQYESSFSLRARLLLHYRLYAFKSPVHFGALSVLL
jgi:hypothetical protein